MCSPLKSGFAGLLFASLGCVMPQLAKADVLLQYTFPASSTYVSTDTDPNSTASNFTFSGMGVSGTDYGRSTATSGPNLNTIFTRGTSLTTSEASAITDGDYYAFTLTPSAGMYLNLTNLTFLTDATQGAAGITYTANFVVRSSLDGYSSNIATISDGPSSSSTSDYTQQTINLSGAAFQNVATPITFRIYLYHTGPSATNSQAITRSDTYVLNGTVSAVPEPSTAALAGAGLALVGLRRRKHA